MPQKLRFVITEDGTSAAQILTGGPRGPRTVQFSALSADWESASITVRQTRADQLGDAQAIAGAEDVTEDTSIPVTAVRSAAIDVVCTSKSGTTPIVVTIE